MKKMILLLISLIITACGQDGRLYLTDEERVEQLQKTQGSTQEIQRIKVRADKEKSLRESVVDLERQETQLRAKGQAKEAEAIYLKKLEAQYEIGQIVGQRQGEGRN